MYTEFFGLTEAPFNSTLDPRFFFRSPQHEEALASLVYAVQERKGLVVLTGDVGSGKTMVSHMLIKRLGQETEAALLNNTCHHGGDLLPGICREFQVPVDASYNTMEMLASLEEFLLTQYSKDKNTVLVIDEAHTLTDKSLEHLRLITNLEVADGKLLQIVLLGQQDLNHMLHKPASRQLRQRVFRNFHIGRLSRDMTAAYVESRLRAAGRGESRIFADEALDLIFQYSNGVPRLINNLCDNLLLSAYSDEAYVVDGPRVTGVIEEMMTGPVEGPDPGEGRRPDEVEAAISEITSQYVQSLENQLQELESTSADTDHRISELHRLSTKLQAQELKISEHQTAIDGKVRELHRLTVTLQEQEHSLSRREKTLSERKNELQALSERLQGQEQRLVEREAKLTQQLRDLERISSQIHEQDHKLSERAGYIDRKLADRQISFDRELNECKRTINRKWQEIKQLIVQFENKETTRNKRLASVDQRLQQFERIRQQITDQREGLDGACQSARQVLEGMSKSKEELQDTVQNQARQTAEHLNQLIDKAGLILQQPEAVMDKASRQMQQVERMTHIVEKATTSLQKTIEQAMQRSRQITDQGRQLCSRLQEVEDDAVGSIKELEQRSGKTHKLREVLREIYERAHSQVTELKSVVRDAEVLMAKLPNQLEQLKENTTYPTRLMQELRSIGSATERNLHDGQVRLTELRTMIDKADTARQSIEALINATRRVADNRRSPSAARHKDNSVEGPVPSAPEPLGARIESLAEAVKKARARASSTLPAVSLADAAEFTLQGDPAPPG